MTHYGRNPKIGNVVRFSRAMERGVVEAPLWDTLQMHHYGWAGVGKLTHIHEGETFLVLDIASFVGDSDRVVDVWYKILFKEGVWWLGWWDQTTHSRETTTELEVISNT